LREWKKSINGLSTLALKKNRKRNPKKKKKKKTQEEIEADKKPTGNILDESQEVDLNELAKRDEKALAER